MTRRQDHAREPRSPRVERCELFCVGERWGVLRVLVALDEAAPPAGARLEIRRADGRIATCAARACALERRLASRGSASALLWRAAFLVELAALCDGHPGVELALDGRRALALPKPAVRPAAPRALELSARRALAERPVLSGARRRVAALATAAAVTAASTPVAAYASPGGRGAGRGSGSATGPAPSTSASATSPPTTTTASTSTTSSSSSSGTASSSPGTTPPASGTTPPASGTNPPASGTTSPPSTTSAGSTPPSSTPPGASTPPSTSSAPTSSPAPGTATSSPAPPATSHRHGDGHQRRPGARSPHAGDGATGSGAQHAVGGPHSARRRHGADGSARTSGPGSGEASRSAPSPATGTPLTGSYSAPAAWTGTVAPNQALTGSLGSLASPQSDWLAPPAFLIPIYMQAGARFGVPWQVLAAINSIETDYGRDLSTSSAGAIGWMQFEPATWREWGMAVDGHSVPNPYDPRDAIFSAARYLAAAGAAHDLAGAIYAYNHAGWYVDEVLARARAIAATPLYERATVRHGTFSVYFATGLARRPTISYRGGVLSHYDRLIAAANMVSAANFPYLYGGGHEQPARFGPFDCSGAVSYVIQQAGYRVPTTVSGEIPIWRFPAGPGRVTIFYNAGHTFMRIGNRYFGTSGFARPGGGAGWFDVNRLPASYLATFAEVHVPDLGVDSFSPSSPATLLGPARPSGPRHRGPRFAPGGLSTLGSFPAAPAPAQPGAGRGTARRAPIGDAAAPAAGALAPSTSADRSARPAGSAVRLAG